MQGKEGRVEDKGKEKEERDRKEATRRELQDYETQGKRKRKKEQ